MMKLKTQKQFIVPTRVGVYRRNVNVYRKRFTLSPREWGCTEMIIFIISLIEIVPTRVGVYRRIFNIFIK